LQKFGVSIYKGYVLNPRKELWVMLMKLLIRGGSISAGDGVSISYVDILTDIFAVKGIEIINRSRSKDNSFDGIRRFDEDIASIRPEFLMLHFGIDDAFLPVYRSEFKENLVHIIHLARTMFDPAIFLLTAHTFSDPYEMDAINIYYQAIREVSVDLACHMIPIHTYWAGYLEKSGFKNSDLTQYDERLPNEKGHEIFATAVTAILKTTIFEQKN
jgi:lysophospholipase L1-like esterase